MNEYFFDNPLQVNRFILSKKNFSQKEMEAVRELCSQREKLHIFKIQPLFRFFHIATRYQAILYSASAPVISLLFLKEKKEITKKHIALYATVLVTSTLAIYTSHLIGRRLVKDIWLNLKTNTLELKFYTFFCRTRSHTVPLNSMHRDKGNFSFDSTVEIGCSEIPHKMATRGVGVWINKSMINNVLIPLEESN